MGIKFPCAHCGQRLNIKSDLAGKRGICPHCHAKIDIPTESVPKVKSPTTWAKASKPGAPDGGKNRSIDDSDESTFDPSIPRTIPSVAGLAPDAIAGSSPTTPASKTATQKLPDPIDEAPELRWYVMPEGSTDKYGPAPGDIMHGWLADGRVGVDSLVWREDWPDWLEAAKVFPQLIKTTAPQIVAPTAPVSAPAAVVNPIAMPNSQVRPGAAPAAIASNPSRGMGAGAQVAGAQPVRPVAGPTVQPNPTAIPGNPQSGVAAQPNAPLLKIDEPLRQIGPANQYVPASKRSKTGSLIAIIVLAVAMLVLVPVVIWVLTRQ